MKTRKGCSLTEEFEAINVMNAVANVNKRSKSTDSAKKQKTKDISEPNSHQGVSGQGKEAKKNNNQEGGVEENKGARSRTDRKRSTSAELNRSRSKVKTVVEVHSNEGAKRKRKSKSVTPKASKAKKAVIDPCFQNVWRKEMGPEANKEIQEKRSKTKKVPAVCEAQINKGNQIIKFSVDADDSFCQSESDVSDGTEGEFSGSSSEFSESEVEEIS